MIESWIYIYISFTKLYKNVHCKRFYKEWNIYGVLLEIIIFDNFFLKSFESSNRYI